MVELNSSEPYTFTEADAAYMKEALALAQKAFDADDTPIGAVLVYQDKIIGRGYNQRNAKKNTLYHAEIEAIMEASAVIGDWRLEDTTLYVTLEPCPMCAGAIVQARIPRVMVGAMNPKAGCAGSVMNILQHDRLNHQAEVHTGLLQEEASALLKLFFSNLRERERSRKLRQEENA